MRWFYSLIFTLLFPVFLAWLFFRSLSNPAYRERWRERLGYSSKLNHSNPSKAFAGSVWVHAVSVGEVQAASPLISALMEKYPQYQMVVTTMTPTGAAQVKNVFGDKVTHCYVPADTVGAVNRFLTRTKPVLGIVIETELWPNLFHYTKKRKVKLILASARLSARSVRGYLKVPGPNLIRATLECLDALITQSNTDAKRFKQLGAPEDRLHVLGNLKFDFKLPKGVRERAAQWREGLGKRPVWIAASTHADEEDIVLKAHAEILKTHPQSLLILVPRHPERFAQVKQLAAQSFSTQSRSDNQAVLEDTKVFVVDSMGELNDFYAASDVAFVAGSLAPIGGHNLLEPAALGLPVLVGPHTFNCEDIANKMLTNEAAFLVRDDADIAHYVTAWLSDRIERRRVGQRGQDLIKRNRGTLQHMLAVVDQVMAE